MKKTRFELWKELVNTMTHKNLHPDIVVKLLNDAHKLNKKGLEAMTIRINQAQL